MGLAVSSIDTDATSLSAWARRTADSGVRAMEGMRGVYLWRR
jgi:hypothetical protein